jgi:hypothetical protein
MFILLLSCSVKNKKDLENAVWAIEEVEIYGETYGVESLSYNLLSFNDDGKGSGFIFIDSPYLSNHFNWEFIYGCDKGKDSIDVYKSNNKFFEGKFQVDLFSENGGHYLVLTSNEMKVRCFKCL